MGTIRGVRAELLPGCTGTGEGYSVPDEGGLLVGRGVECHVHIDCPAVSVRHCRIFRSDDDEYFIEDTSTNHTYINGFELRRRDRLPLMDFDAIRLTKRSRRELVFTIRIQNNQPVAERLRFLYLDRIPDRRSSRRS
jgi:predicted component of type VI protein secretion system